MKKIKAIFVDYSGTLTQEICKATMEFTKMVCMHSSLTDPNDAIKYWWSAIMTDIALERMTQEVGLKADLNKMHELCREYWSKAPLFDDVKPFFEACPYPIYIITNNGVQYVDIAMKDNGLNPAGIVCGDMVKAYKPHKELFLKALEISKCNPSEVVHIGDSEKTDVCGALSVGITPILLNRKNKAVKSDVMVINSLSEVLPLLAKM